MNISDLRKAYPGYGIMLTHDLANGIHDVYGTEINYSQGLAYQWNEVSSFSAANSTIYMDMMSVGLEGYSFGGWYWCSRWRGNPSAQKRQDVEA